MAIPGIQTIRAKKIGLLIRDSREKTGNSVQEIGRMLGVSTGTITAFETGNQSPSLPQLETLAYTLNVPVEHFWGDITLPSPVQKSLPEDKLQRYQILRNKIIGTKIRKARLAKEFSAAELAEKMSIKETTLTAYEFGEQNIPFPMLELLTKELDLNIDELINKKGLVQEIPTPVGSSQSIDKLPKDLQEFVSKPINQPYLVLAKQLSELSADRLRGIAESILEITF